MIGAAAVALAGSAHAAVPAYTLVGSYPAPTFNVSRFDVLPDGRAVFADDSATIFVQDAPNAAAFHAAGSVDPALFDSSFGNFGPGFLRVSPDGSRIAIGDNGAAPGGGRVHLITTASLSTAGHSPTSPIAVPNYEAAWAGNSTLYVSGFNPGTFTPDVFRVGVDAAAVTNVVSTTGEGSGGVVTDGAYLYTADGFNLSDPAQTGSIRAIPLGSLPPDAPPTPPVAFGTGSLVADALTGASLGFDPFGNMLVGGGDFFSGSGDAGYAAVIDASALAAAFGGAGPAPDGAELRLSPAGPGESYGVVFNHATNELLVLSATTVYRYSVPGPGGAAVLGLLAIAARRRRR